MTNLKLHWLIVLDATTRAVADATVICGLAAEESRTRLARLSAERAWVERFTWPAT
jgi:hypothetical protein